MMPDTGFSLDEMRFLADLPEVVRESPFEKVDDRAWYAINGDLGGLPYGWGHQLTVCNERKCRLWVTEREGFAYYRHAGYEGVYRSLLMAGGGLTDEEFRRVPEWFNAIHAAEPATAEYD